MTFDEALGYAIQQQPQIIYLGGKTCTGKSTFAQRLKDASGYRIVELDLVVRRAVIRAHDLADEGMVFVQVYKLRERLDWVRDFVSATQAAVQRAVQRGEKLIVEGAVANPQTLKEILGAMPDAEFFYFHPRSLGNYERNLTERFMRTTKDHNAGLPHQFWKLMNAADFEQFCNDRVLTDELQETIHEYAVASQRDSQERLGQQSAIISGITVIDI